MSNLAALGAAWMRLAKIGQFWLPGNTSGEYIVKLLIDHWGRPAAEEVALYWNQAGRDDIAARIKTIIHQGEKQP